MNKNITDIEQENNLSNGNSVSNDESIVSNDESVVFNDEKNLYETESSKQAGEADGMRYPSIDQLVKITHSKYKLVVAVAKRARDLNQTATNEKALVENPHSKKNIGIALEEIVENKIRVVDKNVVIDKDITE